MGANSFRLEQTPFQKRDKIKLDGIASTENVSIHLKSKLFFGVSVQQF